MRTTADIAKEAGVSKRTLQENKQLARDLVPESKEAVRKTDASKQDALKLARKPQEEQEAIAGKLENFFENKTLGYIDRIKL